MAPIVLDGDTLGEKHHYLNKLVTKAVLENRQPEKLNPDNNDIDNLLNIDIASKQRNVQYILEVLQSDDMLYVSRSIKKSQWLWTDSQYSHIINPEYLHSKLFPNMTFRARKKLLLHIRLNLKDGKRVDQFYKYYKGKNPKVAIKWLMNCSLSLMEEEGKNHLDEIEPFRRLCEKSITFVKIAIEQNNHNITSVQSRLENVMFLLKTNTEKYLDIIEDLDSNLRPQFGSRATKFIMKKCPRRVIDNFKLYEHIIDLETFAKNMKKVDIKGFFLKCENMKGSVLYWYRYDKKDILKFIPKEERFEILKQFFMKPSINNEELVVSLDDEQEIMDCWARFTSGEGFNYRWYRFAPFKIAFSELKKLICSESSPIKRNAMLTIMLTCAKGNPQHVHTLLQFYHDKHINEPFVSQMKFVYLLLSRTNTWTYDDDAWKLLNTIFYSMGVYDEHSKNNAQSCIESIIVYKVLHNEVVPEIIEYKFQFNTLKKIQRKLNEVEKRKLFDYLYTTELSKINDKNISHENDLLESVRLITNVISLLADWEKDIIDFPEVLNKIKELTRTWKDKGWKTDLSSLYKIKKSWRKIMFEESLVLYPCENSLLNAIKHDPKLLQRHNNELDLIRNNNNVSLDRFLKKLRIYFPQSVYNGWTPYYLERLNKTDEHKSLTRALCILLPQKQLVDIIEKYSPSNAKIYCSEDDELSISLRKNLAINMHLARPLLPLELALNYAKGHYLQFAVPTIIFLLHDISSVKSREVLPKLLEAPVSVQKHGIRLVFTKLESRELKQIFSDIWKSNRNTTIRAVLFKQTFDLLCQERNNILIEEIWNVLEMFIDNLTTKENKLIYSVLGMVKKVPLAVRGKYCMKSYKYFKSLPVKADCERILNDDVVRAMKPIVELLDVDFVAEFILDSYKDFTTEFYSYHAILSSFLLSAKDEDSQMQRYEKVLSPLWELALPHWGVKIDDRKIVDINVKDLLKQLRAYFQRYVFTKKMVFPIRLFSTILKVLEDNLPIETCYVPLQTWKLMTALIKVLESHKSVLNTIKVDNTMEDDDDNDDPWPDPKWSPIYFESADEFSKLCVQLLRDDISKYFPSIFGPFAKALATVLDRQDLVLLNILKRILENCGGSVEHYLMVLNIVIPEYKFDCYVKKAEDESYTNEIEEYTDIEKMILKHPSLEIKTHYYKANHIYMSVAPSDRANLP